MNKKNIYKTIKKCRLCKSTELKEVLKLGNQYISSTLVKSNKNNILSKIKIPLTLILCKNCSLVQLQETVNPELLFRNYFYRSAVNKTMRDNLKDVVKDVNKKVNLKKGDIIVDIGSNDGVMLSYFSKKLKRIGVEPAKNIDWSGLDNSIKIINNYFDKDIVLSLTKGHKVKAVTAIAMYYDLDNPNLVTKGIKKILSEDGVVCVQVSYLYDTVKDMNFYDICHEHLEYYTLKTLDYIFKKNGLTIFEAETNFTNGGSIRVFARHTTKNIYISPNIKKILIAEKEMGLDLIKTYSMFERKINDLAKWVKKYLSKEKEKGGMVIGLGASTKGNVMLQVCGVDNKLIPYISDRNKSKVGFKTLGTDMKVISERKARNLKPSLMLVSPWYFRDEILKREHKYLEEGGNLLFVMPYPHILNKFGEKKLQYD